MWKKIKNDERTKLVIAYIIIPVVSIILWKISGMVINKYTFPFFFLDFVFIFLPPTILRFLIKKNGLKRDLELFLYMLLSFVLVFLLYYFFYSLNLYYFFY